MTNQKCPRKECGYRWWSRIKSPKCCPKCKRYLKGGKFESIIDSVNFDNNGRSK